MRKILFFIVACSLGLSGFSQRISELPAATSINVGDLLPIVQSGVTKKVAASEIIQFIADSLSNVRILSDTCLEVTYKGAKDTLCFSVPEDDWSKSGDNIENNNTGEVQIGTSIYLKDSAYMERDAFPVLQPGEPVAWVLVPRKPVGGGTKYQFARMRLNQFGDSIFIMMADSGSVYLPLVRDTTYGYLYPATLTDRLGIGTNTPSAALHINTGNYGDDTGIKFGDGSTSLYLSDEDLVKLKVNDTAYLFHYLIGSQGYTFFGYDGGANSIVQDCSGFGYMALQENSGAFSQGFGTYALQYNDGVGSAALGECAGRYNVGNYATGIGYNALHNNIGDRSTSLGAFSMQYNVGNYSIGIGYYNAFNNKGENLISIGREAAYNNIGKYCVAIGNNSGYNNIGDSSVMIGGNAAHHNPGDNNTAIGHNSFNYFNENAAGEKTFNETDIVFASNKIYISSHGFGGVGAKVNLKYTEGSEEIDGYINEYIYSFDILHEDTIQYTGTILDYGSGTGTGYSVTPQYVYSNSTAIGYNSEPTASHQIMLGTSDETVYIPDSAFIAGNAEIKGHMKIGNADSENDTVPEDVLHVHSKYFPAIKLDDLNDATVFTRMAWDGAQHEFTNLTTDDADTSVYTQDAHGSFIMENKSPTTSTSLQLRNKADTARIVLSMSGLQVFTSTTAKHTFNGDEVTIAGNLETTGSLEIGTAVTFDEVVVNTITSEAVTIDWTDGNMQTLPLTDTVTITFTAPTGPAHLSLEIVHTNNTTVYPITWPVGMKWPGGVPITPTAASEAIDVVTFEWNGTYYKAMYGNDFKAIP